MKYVKVIFSTIAVFLIAVLLTIGCGANTPTDGEGGGGGNKDTIAPTVISINPANLATSVAINRNINATFSEKMDSATITTTTFTLMQGVTLIPCTLTYVDTVATLNPTSDLAISTVYTATITTGAKDLAGNALAVNKTWSFATGVDSDTAAPTVISTNPIDLATGVPINGNITATFSEAMDTPTITDTTFTLKQGTTLVPCALTYMGTTATLNPTSDLATNTTYTATITTGVKDLAGNALAVNKAWSFTTGTIIAAGPAPVNLGTAGNFVILSKTGISTTGTTAIVGDIGVSPYAASFITGFALLAPPTTFTTSALVTGNVYAADFDPPTPAYMTTAVSDMELAFTDAAGRTNPSATELGAGNISGMTLAPGLYKWGTGVIIPIVVTLSGGANDVWIFQIDQDLTVADAAMVTLAGGAQSKNVFWQVAGQVTLGTTSNFKGNILCMTLIAMKTGAILNGRALAQTEVTLQSNAVTKPE